MDNYSPSEFITNCFDLIRTKMFYKDCRFIRFPFYIRGGKSMVGAEGLTLGRFSRFELDGKKETLHIGSKCEMGDMTHIVALNDVAIGDNVLIASKCFISDTSHGSYKGADQDSPQTPPNKRRLFSSSVRIGNNVWIGENAVILSGTQIGNGCIVGANSVLKGVFADNSIIVGCPGKIIKQFDTINNEWKRISMEEME